MKNKFYLCLLLLLFSACNPVEKEDSSASSAATSSSLNTESKKTIHISTEEYAPFISEKLKDNGFLAQLISEAFASEGIKVKFEFLPAIRSFESAKAGEYDATVPWAKREERLKDFYFGEPLMESDNEVFFYLEGKDFEWDPAKQDYSLLKDKVIGAIASANYSEKFMKAEKAGIIKVDRVTHTYQNLRKLAANRIDLMISPEKIALHELNLEREKYEPLQYVKSILAIEEELEYDYLIISRKGKHAQFFNEAFNKGMKKLKSSGRYNELYRNFTNSLKE